jgi:ABC-type uncharacterized transport system auxiliary subunit
MKTLLGRSLLILTACALAAGCSLSTPYPSRALYTLNVSAPASEAHPIPKPITLRVRNLIAVEPFNGLNFIYRTAPTSITADYYNAFAAPPADLLTVQLVQYLRATHTFATVTDASGSATHQWVLEGRLQDLSIDVATPSKPEAILTLQIVILDESGPITRVLFDHTYTERTPLPAAAPPPANAAAAWSTCAHSLFQHLATDLTTLPTSP